MSLVSPVKVTSQKDSPLLWWTAVNFSEGEPSPKKLFFWETIPKGSSFVNFISEKKVPAVTRGVEEGSVLEYTK